MKRKWLPLLIVPAAAAGYLAFQSNFADEIPASAPTLGPATAAPRISPTATESPTPAFEGCYYNWAYQDLPELSEKVDTAIRALNPNASAYAQAFGEDCVYTDGPSTFGAMETDFYVRLSVSDLANEEALGNWIGQVMPVIISLPAEEVPGPQPGFVEFWFTKSDAEQIFVRVPIQQYREISPGKSGAELFRWFYLPQTSPT